jgi:hypothetical protein
VRIKEPVARLVKKEVAGIYYSLTRRYQLTFLASIMRNEEMRDHLCVDYVFRLAEILNRNRILGFSPRW